MKKLSIIFLGLISLFIGFDKINAAGSISVNTNSIYLGNSVTVTVTVSGAAAWETHITVSGAASASNCGTLDFADSSENALNTSKTYTTTCKPAKTGTVNFALSGNTTDENGVTTNISGSKSVTVNNKPVQQPAPQQKPAQTQKPATNNTVTPKSSVNYLKTLEIEGKSLNPAFNKETLEYTIELEPGTTSINVKAEKEHNKANVIGTGVKNVTEGVNNFEIVVTAENGSKRTYKIKAIVKEKDPISVYADNKKYTVIRKREHLIPASAFYSESTTPINGEEIPSYYGEVTGYTLVGLKDEEGKIDLFIYDEENNKYKLYHELNFSRIIFYPLEPSNEIIPKGYFKTHIMINEMEIPCYKKSEDDNLVLIYGVNIENNNEDFYVYDSFENTLQRYDDTIFDSYKGEILVLKSIIFGLICIISVLLVVSALQGSVNKARKSLKKELKEEKKIKKDKEEAKLLSKELKRKEKEQKKKNKRNRSLDDTSVIDITNINIKKK